MGSLLFPASVPTCSWGRAAGSTASTVSLRRFPGRIRRSASSIASKRTQGNHQESWREKNGWLMAEGWPLVAVPATGPGSGPARSKLRSRFRLPRNSNECLISGLCATAALAEGHVHRLPFIFTLPVEEKFSIGFRDVADGRNAQVRRRAVDPAWMAFDFRDIANGRVVEYDVASAVAPLGAEFLVDEDWPVAQGAQYRVHLAAVGDFGLKLRTGLVLAGPGTRLVCQPPRLAVRPQTQELTTAA